MQMSELVRTGAACLLAAVLAAGCVSSSTVRGSSAESTAPVGGGTETGFSRPERTPAEETGPFVPPTPVGPIASPGDVAEPMPGGVIDWSGRVVRSRGTGVLDPGNTNKAQARLMAERAATVVAQRNLLEIIKGVRVDSETKVQNYMTEYDVIYSRVDGIVKGARQLGPAKYDSLAGTVEVELEVAMYGDSSVGSVLEPVLGGGGSGDFSASSVSPQVREFLRQYSGILLDAGTSGLKPAMYPKIFDSNGNLLLDTRDYIGKTGAPGAYAMQFVQKLDDVLARPEFANSPLVLKVRQVTGRLGTDIILGNEDAGKLKWLKDSFKYLAAAGRFILKLAL
ncbi:MAG: hypothetical protein R6X13_05615 [bacterium]